MLEREKCQFVPISLLVDIFLFVCVIFWSKKYIFSYTLDLCGRVGDKNFFACSISGKKNTFFFGLTLLLDFFYKIIFTNQLFWYFTLGFLSPVIFKGIILQNGDQSVRHSQVFYLAKTNLPCWRQHTALQYEAVNKVNSLLHQWWSTWQSRWVK